MTRPRRGQAHTTIEQQAAQMTNTAPALESLGVPAYQWLNDGAFPITTTAFHHALPFLELSPPFTAVRCLSRPFQTSTASAGPTG